MQHRLKVVFSGSGGQGVITAAIILAEAAVMYEDLNAVQSQSYGPEARGGAARSEVIISDSEIFFPKVLEADLLICLTQKAYDKFSRILRPGSILITDSYFVKSTDDVDGHCCELHLYETILEKVGKSVVFNIGVLGALLAVKPVVKPDSVMQVLESRLPPNLVEANRTALEIGYELGSWCGK